MRKIFLTLLLTLLAAAGLQAQVTNYAIELEADGNVNCGPLPELDGKSSYTLQMWMKPTEWTEGATLLSRGDGLKLTLGAPGVVNVKIGDTNLTKTNVPVDAWSLLTVRVNEGIVYINNTRKSSKVQPLAAVSDKETLVLGGGYKGRLDEVRIWGIALPDEFNRFEHTTLNRFNPYWNDLLVYLKMDQEQCEHLVDYKGVYCDENTWNHHGVFSASGVKRVEAENPDLPYLINSAYTANERFYDRSIPREQYLFANDLIILGIQSYADGHLKYCTPNCHATLLGNAKRLDEFEGREGVMAFDGQSTLDCGSECFEVTSNIYAFECWLYIEEWVEGAYIIRKETEDGQHGISISLGREANKEVIVRVNGNKFINQRNMSVGKWVHLAINTENAGTTRDTFVWIFNGTRVGYASDASDETTANMPEGNTDCHAIVGEGFKGKMDNLLIWNRSIGRSATLNEPPMPALNKTVTSDVLQRVNTYLDFDDPARPGFDKYSQDHWKEIMEAAYEGHRGYQIRISVKSHNGWENTLWDANKRKIFAEDLARLSEGYDGVELDLEWIYSTQTQLGLLSDDIRAALPEGKTLMISCHNVASAFPKNKMANCDGFTFQQYGPQKEHSCYSTFVNYTNNFINYGFPKEKILCSYATTTSVGYQNGVRPAGAPDIKGVRDGFLDGDYVPQEEVDCGISGGYEFYFDGPLQTYMRAKFVTDNRLGGIFYWDMGNDVRPDHRYNLAKWSTYGLNHNVDTLITHVEIHHFDTAIDNVVADRSEAQLELSQPEENTLVVKMANGKEPRVVRIYDLAGHCVAEHRGTSAVNVSRLGRGYYIVEAEASGRGVATASAKYLRR